MTTSTTDAEAIARIIDPLAFDVESQTFCTPAYWKARSDHSLERATAILSYLASRRETQEPVAWLRDIDGTGSLHPASKGDPGAFPVYTAPPAPAGEVEMPTPNNRFSPRMLLLDDLHAVCVGGRWDGWKFWKHPDGQWVSLEKLAEEPRAALNGGRE